MVDSGRVHELDLPNRAGTRKFTRMVVRLAASGDHGLGDSASLVRARGLLLENGWCDTAELGLLPVLPPLLKIHNLYARSQGFGFG